VRVRWGVKGRGGGEGKREGMWRVMRSWRAWWR